MSANPVTCGNCGTENPPDRDFCINCGQPLTASAEEGLLENLEAQGDDSLFGGGRMTGAGGLAGAGGIVAPLVPGDAGVDPGRTPRTS
ncbi:MAG: Double zinc ribbon [Thermomicrobiales bacterium]|jgi:hypothetical protein|nr:Double zinc ribbon [Thermomicrobiales bacterium]